MNSGSSPVLRRGRVAASILLIAVLLALTFPPSENVRAAGPWYVAPSGLDSNSCTAPASPCLTINGAIAKASAWDTIYIKIGTYTSTSDSVVEISKDIVLSGGWNASFTAQTGLSEIDGQDARRGIAFVWKKSAVISRFFIHNGTTGQYGGGIVLVESSLSLLDSIIRDNSAGSTGGGISSLVSSTVEIRNTEISDNFSLQPGGGIYSYDSTLVMENSTVSGNQSNSGGGGIAKNGTVGSITIRNSTITLNAAPEGGGVYTPDSGVTLENSIVAGNSAVKGPDCKGAVASSGYNLIGENSDCDFTAAIGDQVGTNVSLVNPLMGPLAANGGLTLTHGLAANSPARNAGNPAVPGTGGSACLATDQRGVARPVDGVCDIGAFEGSVPVVSSTWYVSVSGDDSHSCTTPTEPCLTINGAIARAVSGETIKVGIGTYTGPGTEVVLINKNLIFLGGWDAGFTSQTGVSTVDGQQTRQAIKIDVGRRVVMDRFEIQNGYHVISGGIENTGVLTLTNSTVSHNNSFSWGAGIHNQGNLTLNHTVVSDNTSEWQAGGIYSGEGMMLIINNSTIRDNVGGEAGGVESNGTLAMNNITLSGNQAGGNWAGSAMNVSGTVVINNSTLSSNLGVPAIFFRGGSMAINNSTIAGNPAGGTKTYSNAVELRNSIVALNTAGGGSDCTGLLLSFGYNLIGNTTGCGFTAAAGDLVGTSTDPIDPRLGLLTDNGGSTLTHALSGISPALNAGNPAPPGSGGDTCEATDQRGVARPVEARCDIGAYEGSVTLVTSFTRVNPSPTSALFVKFTVKFSEPVTGVDMVAPFSDFGLTTAGLTGAAITSVSGSGDTYQVTVNVGSGVGTIRLDVLDDDTILDLSSHPLGGVGAGNGDLPGPTYTIIYPRVTSFLRSNPNPTSASTVKFNIRFSGPVTGVDKVAPFSDFTLTTTGLTGAAITGVSGTGSNYVVTVKTGQGNGTLQLKLVDDDTIRSASDNPLGGPGAGNGGFVGPTYTVRKIPTLLSPVSITTWDRTPAFKWSNNIPAVTQYQLQIWRGTTLLYSKNVFPGSCTATACTFTPGTPLPAAAYKWRVRAAASGIWLPFSAYRALTVFAPKAGYWRGDWNDFYVTPDLASVTNFAIYVSVSGCGNYKITHTAPVPIVNGRFSFSGSFYASGSFSTTGTSATGKLGLYYFYIPGCGYLKGGPVDWSAVWNSSAQADLGAAIELLPLPGPEGTFPGPFIIESVQP